MTDFHCELAILIGAPYIFFLLVKISMATILFLNGFLA